MATIKFSNMLVGASLRLPLTGAWRFHGPVDIEDALSGSVTVEIDELELTGTVVKAGFTGGVQIVRVVGGAGKLSALCTPRGYQNPSTRQIATDILSVGEALDDTSQLTGNVPAWAITSQPAGLALDVLMHELGDDHTWRVLDNGKIWIGKETWPTLTLENVEIDADPSRDVVHLASFFPTLKPGVVLDGRKIGRVVHQVAEAGILTEAWTV